MTRTAKNALEETSEDVKLKLDDCKKALKKNEIIRKNLTEYCLRESEVNEKNVITKKRMRVKKEKIIKENKNNVRKRSPLHCRFQARSVKIQRIFDL